MLLSLAIDTAFKGYLSLQNTIENDFELNGIAPLESATPTQISYIDQDKYLSNLTDSQAGAVFIRPHLLDKVPSHIQPLVVENPHLAFALLSQLFAAPCFTLTTQNPRTNNIQIGANVVIGDNVSIGEHCKIYPNVVIYRDSIIGNRVNIHAGSIIGCDGLPGRRR